MYIVYVILAFLITTYPTAQCANDNKEIIKFEVDPEVIQEIINTFSNITIEKPLAKVALFIAGSIVASYGAYLIGSSCKHAIFPPQKPLLADADTHKNYRKNCFMRGMLGALIGSGLTYAGIMAIIRSDRIFNYYHAA